MLEIKPQTILQINCIQIIISELSNKLSQLNLQSLNQTKLRKILLRIIYKYPIVIQNSFSFLIKINPVNILVSWDLEKKSFGIDVTSISEPEKKIDNFVQNYIQSELADKNVFDKLSVLIGNINLKKINPSGKMTNIVAELKNISFNTNENGTNFNFSFYHTSNEQGNAVRAAGVAGSAGSAGSAGFAGTAGTQETTVQISIWDYTKY
jgi:hypothetical protein